MTQQSKTKVLLYGLGAIGGFYAFILSRDPEIELTVVARSNYEAVKKNGLRIDSKNHGTHTVHLERNRYFCNHNPHVNLVLNTPDEVACTYDYILCVHKAISPNQVPESFHTITSKTTTFVILQNGVGNEDPFREAFPENTIISCVLWVGASQPSPGHIQHIAAENTEVGLFPNPKLDAPTEESRLQGFANMLKRGGTPFAIKSDVQLKRWEKLVWNAAWNPLTMLTSVDTARWLSSSPQSMVVTKRLMNEMIEVGRACGVNLREDLADVLVDRAMAMPGFGSSMQADAREGRPMEVEVILGTPVRKAEELGIHVPTLEMIYALTVAVDQRLRAGNGGSV